MACYRVNLFRSSVVKMTLPNEIAEIVVAVFVLCQVFHWLLHKLRIYQRNYKHCPHLLAKSERPGGSVACSRHRCPLDVVGDAVFQV